ncbi:MAG: tetratricopeptide repeat protein, partial [Myxococcaceae bacterium]
LKEAERLYNVGKYKEAAELLEKVNEESPNPKLLYNIARAWDQAGELEKSLDAYQRYVGSKDGTDATLLKRAVLSIDRLKGLIAKADEEKKKSDAERLKSEEESKAAQAKAEADAEAARKALEEAQAKRDADLLASNKVRSRNKAIAIGAGAVGVLALGGGTFMGLSARGSKAKFDAATTVEDKRNFESTTKTQALLADVGFGVGLAALVTAIVVYPKGTTESGEEEQQQEDTSSGSDESSFRILVGPTSAGFQVRF